MFVNIIECRLTIRIIERLFGECYEIRGDVMEYLIAFCVRNLFISARWVARTKGDKQKINNNSRPEKDAGSIEPFTLVKLAQLSFIKLKE